MDRNRSCPAVSQICSFWHNEGEQGEEKKNHFKFFFALVEALFWPKCLQGTTTAGKTLSSSPLWLSIPQHFLLVCFHFCLFKLKCKAQSQLALLSTSPASCRSISVHGTCSISLGRSCWPGITAQAPEAGGLLSPPCPAVQPTARSVPEGIRKPLL